MRTKNAPWRGSNRMTIFTSRKSFTLIELLVVLGIVAILSTVVIVALNPAELLKQARDSDRMSDMATLSTALGAFAADSAGSFMGTSSVVYISIPDNASSTCGSVSGLPSLPAGWSYNCVSEANQKKADGTGWIPVNFSAISFGSPLSSLPVDPTNATSTSYYAYVTGGSFKVAATGLESQKYLAQASADGGLSNAAYERGTDLTLAPGFFALCPTSVSHGGESYSTVTIYNQCWLARNLNIGTQILSSASAANNGTVEKYCYSDSSANCDTDGGLYQWDEAMGYSTTEGAQGICPSGWRIPKDSDWYALESYYATGSCVSSRTAEGCSPAGTALKSGGSSGFVIVMAGYAYGASAFYLTKGVE